MGRSAAWLACRAAGRCRCAGHMQPARGSLCAAEAAGAGGGGSRRARWHAFQRERPVGGPVAPARAARGGQEVRPAVPARRGAAGAAGRGGRDAARRAAGAAAAARRACAAARPALHRVPGGDACGVARRVEESAGGLSPGAGADQGGGGQGATGQRPCGGRQRPARQPAVPLRDGGKCLGRVSRLARAAQDGEA